MAFAAFQNENSNSRREPKGCFKFWVDFANSEKKTDSRFNNFNTGKGIRAERLAVTLLLPWALELLLAHY